MARLSFRCSDELLARVDAARGGEPREAWLRRVVEAAVSASGGELELTVVRGLVEKDNRIQAASPGVPVEFRMAGVRPAREFQGPYDPFKKR